VARLREGSGRRTPGRTRSAGRKGSTPARSTGRLGLPDNETAFRVLAKIGLLEVVKTETFPAEPVELFVKAFA
jgi:hypothetical protein